MANQEHIEILKQGVEAWNKWREANRYIKPDLSGIFINKILPKKVYSTWFGEKQTGVILESINFSNTNLKEANLYKANLQGAKLQEANLQWANLFEANLERANLERANLEKADLSRANLKEAKLQWANLQEAKLDEANIYEANLEWAKLQEAKLYKANLEGANLKNTKFSSKKQLNYLKNPLSEKQLIEAIFLDEQEKEKKNTNRFDAPFVQIKFQKGNWRSDHLALLFWAIDQTYRNLYYLLTTKETDYEKIKSTINKRYFFLDDNETIKIKSIHTNSLDIQAFFSLISENTTNVLIFFASFLYGSKGIGNAILDWKLKVEKIKNEKAEGEIKSEKIKNEKAEGKLKEIIIYEKQIDCFQKYSSLDENLKKTIQDKKLIPEDMIINNPVVKKNKEEFFINATALMMPIIHKWDKGKTEIKFFKNEEEFNNQTK